MLITDIVACFVIMIGLVEFITGGKLIINRFAKESDKGRNKGFNIKNPVLAARLGGLSMIIFGLVFMWAMRALRETPSDITPIYLLIAAVITLPLIILILTIVEVVPKIVNMLSTKRPGVTSGERSIIKKIKIVIIVVLVVATLVAIGFAYLLISILN